MKKIFIILFLTPVAFLLHAQKINFDWVKQMGGTDPVDARGLSLATDASGNVYSTGFFTGKVDFDPGPGIYNLTPLGTEDLYITKLDSSGKFIWAKQIDNIIYAIFARGRAIDVDAFGNVYITGYFLDNNNNGNCFVSKLDTDGNFLWTKQMGQSSNGTSIKVDAAGNVYTSGFFTRICDFDPGPETFNLGVLGTGFMTFISKFDPDGNFIWAKEIRGYNIDVGSGNRGRTSEVASLALDAVGNVYVSGDFSFTVDFDPGMDLFILTAEYTLTSVRDIFILKLDGAGNFIWAKKMGGLEDDYGVSIAVDGAGNVYTAGNFSGTSDFDPGPDTYNLITANSVSNIFISKLDDNGNFTWAKQLAGSSPWCFALTLDIAGNVYTTGYFGNTLDFDPGPGSYNLFTSGYDKFVSKLDASGNFVWAKQIGGTGTIISNSITIDALENIYTSGYFFGGPMDFDAGTGNYNLTTDGSENIFILKMTPCAKTSSSITTSVCTIYTLNGQVYNTSGVYKQTLTNVVGCDSIITLNLTVKTINALVAVTACKSYAHNNHIYNISGTYTDTLVAANGCDSVITLQLTIKPESFSTSTQSICVGQSYYGHTASGTYIDTLVAVNGCNSITTLSLTVLPKPSPDLGADTSLCAGKSLVLYPGKFTAYTWQDGSVQNNITVKTPGLYAVTVTDNCGSATDEIIIKDGICDIYFPTSFTPNNDGKNDFFKILGANNLTGYHMLVYNRWGQKVFETFNPSTGWNGSLNGQAQSSANFVWYCEFTKQGDANKTRMQGIVTLIK